MSSVVLDAEYIDSGEDESEESAVELWSPSASDSDRASVYLPSPQTLDSLGRRGRKELTSGERQMKWALNCFSEWCHSEGLNVAFEDISAAELNDLLKKFYSNARRKDGMEFSKPGFTNIRLMIDRYFKTNLQRFPIIRNADFEESNKVFETKIARLSVSGQNSWRRPCSISPKDIEKLLSCGVFSAENPFNLLLACWFNVTLHFDCGDHLKQRKLSKFQFLFKTNSSGVEYVKFASSSEVRAQLLKSTSQEDESSLIMYSVPPHPLCPVKLLRKYLNKLHPEFDSLYQCPVPYSVDDRVPIWYEKRPVGIHQLEAMMGTISKDAELSRVYSNACLKATSPLMYLSCGFNAQSQSDQQGRQHGDGAITDVSSTPSKTLHSPRSSTTLGETSTPSNPSAFSSSSLSSSCSNEDNNASHLSEGQSFVNSCFQPTLEETYQDNSDITPTDLGHPSASNVPCKIDSVCGGFGGEFIAGYAKKSPASFCQVVNPVDPPTLDVPASEVNSTAIACGKTYLRFQVTEGKLFLEPDINGANTASQGEKKFASTVTIHVHFMHQRLQSKPVRCAYELAFKEDFYLEFENIINADVGALLSIPDKIHLVLITTDTDGRTSLVSSHHLNWQRVLAAEDGKLASSVELNGVGAEAKMMVGVLEINVMIVPKAEKAIAADELRSCVSLSQCRVSERDRQFMGYARHWWKELISSGPPHCRHSVKIFAQDECGSSHPVVSYVRPLNAGWVLDTPIQAAEFVSLLAFEEEASMWGGRTEMWNSLHVFLSRRKGGCEDHATLLCSLLLGFGLNAYVCCGTKANDTSHVWVMTQRQNGDLSFWESLSGQRFNLASKTSSLEAGFKTIGCVFNHTSFYANIQSSDFVSSCSFDFNNPCHWKAMSEDKIQAFCGEDISPPLPRFPPLLAPAVYPWIASQKMEEEMKEIITHHRKSLGLPTEWENNISYRLAPAVSSSYGDYTADVKEAVDRIVPPGFSFATRVHSFKHRSACHAVEHMLKLPETESLIVGDDVTLALRVRVNPYPENTCVARVIIASLWRENNGAVKFEWED